MDDWTDWTYSMIISNNLRIRASKIVLTLNNVNSPNFSQGQNTKIIYSCSLPGYLQSSARIQRLVGFVSSTLDLEVYGANLQDAFAFTRYNIIIVQPWINQVEMYSGYLDNLKPQADGTYLDADVKREMDTLPIIWLGQVTDAGIDFNSEDRPLKINSVMTLRTITQLSESNNQEVTTLSDIAYDVINQANLQQNGEDPFRRADTINYVLTKVEPDRQVFDFTNTGSLPPLQFLDQLAQNYGYLVMTNFSKTTPFTIEIQLVVNQQIQDLIVPFDVANFLNSKNGMIGYPQVEGFGILVTEYFNPDRRINDLIILDETYYAPIKGVYLYVWQYNSTLETHDDSWESQLTCFGYNNPS